MLALAFAPLSLRIKSQLRLPNANGRIAFSAKLLSISMSPLLSVGNHLKAVVIRPDPEKIPG